MSSTLEFYSGKPNVITQNDIGSTLDRCYQMFRFGATKVPLLDGLPGLAKSAAIREWSDRQTPGRTFYDVRFGNLLPSDIRIPFPDLDEGACRTLLTEALPFHEDPNGHYTVRLDEVLQCGRAMQNVLMQVAHDREVDGHKLPADTFLVAAGNGSATRSHGEKWGAAQLDRFSRYYVQPDLGGFQAHLRKDGRFAEFDAFLKLNPNLAYNFDLKTWDGESALSTFRSLHEVGRLLLTYKEPTTLRFIPGNGPTDDPLFLGHATALAGAEVAKALHAFLVIFNSVGSIDNVIANPTGFTVPDDPSTKWVIACKLVGEATTANVGAVLKAARHLAPGRPGFLEMFVGMSIMGAKPSLQTAPDMIRWMSEPEVLDASIGR